MAKSVRSMANEGLLVLLLEEKPRVLDLVLLKMMSLLMYMACLGF